MYTKQHLFVFWPQHFHRNSGLSLIVSPWNGEYEKLKPFRILSVEDPIDLAIEISTNNRAR